MTIGKTIVVSTLAILLSAGVARAQFSGQVSSGAAAATKAEAGVVNNASDYLASAELAKMAAAALEKARASANGTYNTTWETYPGHFVNITARVKSGGAELHQHYNDLFIVLDGEMDEVTRGTIPDMKLDAATGEGRGTKIVGGVDNMLKKGDVLHIAPNTPHQSLIEPGKYFVAMVVKIHAD